VLKFWLTNLTTSEKADANLIIAKTLESFFLFYHILALFQGEIMFQNASFKADKLSRQGLYLLNNGQMQAGINLLIEAASIYEQIGNLKEAAERFDAIAAICTQYGRLEEAVNYNKYSLKLEKQLANPNGVATSLSNLGTVYLMMGRIEDALNSHNEALQIYRDHGDIASEAHCLFNIANVYSQVNNKKAISYYEKTVKIAEKIGGATIMLVASISLGTHYDIEGDSARAIKIFERSLNYLEKITEEERAQLVIMNQEGKVEPRDTIFEKLIQVYTQKREYSNALKYGNQALEIQRSKQNQKGIAKFEGLIGHVYLEMAQLSKALEHTEKSIQILRQYPPNSDLARDLGQLASIYHQRGEINKALSCYHEASTSSRSIRDSESYFRIRANLGLLYLEIGKFTQALECLEEALQNAQFTGSKLSEAKALGNIGLIYQDMKNYSSAFNYFEAAMRIHQEIGDAVGEAIQLGNIGQVALKLNNPKAAIQYFKRSLELNITIGNLRGEAFQLNNLGSAFMAQKEYDNAIQYLNLAIEKSRTLGDRKNELITLCHLGSVYRNTNQDTDALNTWNTAINLALNLENHDIVRNLFHVRGHLYEKQGLTNQAYEDYKESIIKLELLRQQIMSGEQKLSFLNLNTTIVYSRMIALLFNKFKRNEETYEYIRRAKSQVFMDQIRHLHINPPSKIPTHLCSIEKQLIQKLKAQEKVYFDAQLRSEKHLAWVEMGKISEQLHDIIEQTSNYSPEYAAWRQSHNIHLRQIYDIISKQDIKITVAEFFVLVDKVLLTVLNSDDKKLSMLEIPIDMEKLGSIYRSHRREVAEYPIMQLRETWHEISNALVDPLSSHIENSDLLCVIPHMQLHGLPFHSLMLNGKRLIEYIPIVYLHTSQLLRHWQLESQIRSKKCLALGYAKQSCEKSLFENEAKQIVKEIGGEAYTGEKATKATIAKLASQFSYLHISCHGTFNNDPI